MLKSILTLKKVNHMQELLQRITKTVSNAEVKNLRWLPTDNIIVGQVKDDIFGNPNVHDGFCSGMWNRLGIPVNRIKGRSELKLVMNLELPI